MKYSYAAVSDVGKREINEDALEVRAGRGYLACALGDGLGGQGSGDFASKLATDVSIRRMSGFLPIGRRTLMPVCGKQTASSATSRRSSTAG